MVIQFHRSGRIRNQWCYCLQKWNTGQCVMQQKKLYFMLKNYERFCNNNNNDVTKKAENLIYRDMPTEKK